MTIRRLSSNPAGSRCLNIPREAFTVGILGAGVLGSKVAEALAPWGFPLRCWSRSRKDYPGVESFAGTDELPAFLNGTRVLINLLPNTAETVGIINEGLLNQLDDQSYLMNWRAACIWSSRIC